MAALLKGRLVTGFEIGQRTDQFASGSICRYGDVVELDNAVDVEKILEFAGDSQLKPLSEIKETRITKVHVKLRRRGSRITPDADWPVGGRDAVAVEIRAGDDVVRFAAVRGADNAEYIVVEEIPKHLV